MINEFISYERSIWINHIPDDFNQLAVDISFIINDLSIIYIGIGKDKGNILFYHKNDYFLLLAISSYQYQYPYLLDVMNFNIRTGTDIDTIYHNL